MLEPLVAEATWPVATMQHAAHGSRKRQYLKLRPLSTTQGQPHRFRTVRDSPAEAALWRRRKLGSRGQPARRPMCPARTMQRFCKRSVRIASASVSNICCEMHVAIVMSMHLLTQNSTALCL